MFLNNCGNWTVHTFQGQEVGENPLTAQASSHTKKLCSFWTPPTALCGFLQTGITLKLFVFQSQTEFQKQISNILGKTKLMQVSSSSSFMDNLIHWYSLFSFLFAFFFFSTCVWFCKKNDFFHSGYSISMADIWP